MPKAAGRYPSGEMTWIEYQEPVLASGQIRVRSQFSAAKHGTELAMFKRAGFPPRGRYDKKWQLFIRDDSAPARGAAASPAGVPVKPAEAAPLRPGGVGNMTVGIVEEVAPDASGNPAVMSRNGDPVAVGDRVLCHGGFRQTHVTQAAGVWKIPKDLSWKSAVCLDPADFALGALRDGQVRVGDAVAIFGLGAIGLMAVQLAKVAGAAPVIGVDPLSRRLDIARKVGADLVLDPTGCDAGWELKKATDGMGVDVALEYSGSVEAMQAALRGVAYGGNVVMGAFPAPYQAGLDLGAEAHLNIPNLIFSRSCSEPGRDHPRWNESRLFKVCLRLLREGIIGGEEIVRPVVKFESILEHYPRIGAEPNEYIKIGVEY